VVRWIKGKEGLISVVGMTRNGRDEDELRHTLIISLFCLSGAIVVYQSTVMKAKPTCS
jgi:hypothetical protein